MIKRLFHFLGGVYFAIFLISLAAGAVVLGTFLESLTQSHLYAAHYIYHHAAFNFLLSLFFVNILFSSLRRWPFKKRHLPFLITHLGLLMVIGGTMIKNQWGLQGNLTLWEGSGNQEVLLPHTHALVIEKKGEEANEKQMIPLSSLQRSVHYPSSFKPLKLHVLGSVPHVKQHLATWIKDSKAYLNGLPPFAVQPWSKNTPLPSFTTQQVFTHAVPWQFLALHTVDGQEAIRQTYLQGLEFHLTTGPLPHQKMKISLEKTLDAPFLFEGSTWLISLNLAAVTSTGFQTAVLTIQRQEKEQVQIDLQQGEGTLEAKTNSPYGLRPTFYVDLVRAQPSLCLLEDENKDNILVAFDCAGRVHGQSFAQADLQTLLVYDQAFGGYAIQAQVPIPTFPASRQDQQKADQSHLEQQLRQVLLNQTTLAPPLQLLREACQRSAVDFVEVLVQFLTTWHQTPGILFNEPHALSQPLEQALGALNWSTLSLDEQRGCQWTAQLFLQFETALQQGEDLLTLLKRIHWPFMEEVEKSLATTPEEVMSLVAQQFFTLISSLPALTPQTSPLLSKQAHWLSAYFKAYGIDYVSLAPSHYTSQSPLERLETYWRTQAPAADALVKRLTLFETPLILHLTPDTLPAKMEERMPGLMVEVQQGKQKELLFLAYDETGTGLKWPLLNGEYIIRFQPQVHLLPYRVRLRQARQIFYPQSTQVYSYESDIWLSSPSQKPIPYTLSMNRVYETWDGYRFYLAGIGTSDDQTLKQAQLVINHDPAKYGLTYPGALLVFLGIFLLFWGFPIRHSIK